MYEHHKLISAGAFKEAVRDLFGKGRMLRCVGDVYNVPPGWVGKLETKKGEVCKMEFHQEEFGYKRKCTLPVEALTTDLDGKTEAQKIYPVE